MIVINNLLVILVVYPIAVGVLLWGGNKIVRHWAKEKKCEKRVLFYNNLVQSLIWVFVALHILYLLVKVEVSLLLWAMVLFFLGRQFLQNFLAGILFRLERGNLQGASISIDTKEGIIISYKITKLCLKSVNGNCVYVPYEEVYKKGFTRRLKTERSEVQNVKVYLNDDKQISEENLSLLRKKILLNPYIAVNEKMHLTQGEENDRKWVQITYVLANPERAESIKEEFARAITSFEE